jgi:UDP-N-acetylglucosamine--N-acetylmuramyl-(pentapeptide) pyrophosphoryl-undecaprenol N-acetylglucosamine transferase
VAFALALRALFLTVPTAGDSHPCHNARALAAAGAAVHLPQSELTVQTLDRQVRALLADPSAMARLAAGASARARPDAAETIARRILSLLDLQQLRS